MPFNISDYPESFTIPQRMTSLSAWLYHIPLVPMLVNLLRPRTFVELGTHAGDSYVAFCSAIKSGAVGTQCTAVDTWKGDAHTGPYGPEVLASLRQVHDQQFGEFSRLLVSDFNSAAPTFADGSIDLLHMDGAHDYATVRHDYMTWQPKLSDRAVVLFHDTAERTGGFGVWQLWDEVRAGHPHAHLPYGHGLGILALGPQVPGRFLEFISALNNDIYLVRHLEALGHRLQLVRNNSISANALHTCQMIANEWRQRTGQAIRNATPNLSRAVDVPGGFAPAVMDDIRQMAIDALNLMQEVSDWRKKAGKTG